MIHGEEKPTEQTNMACTIYMIFISKPQWLNEKQRLIMRSDMYSEQEIRVSLVGFEMNESHFAWFLAGVLLKYLYFIL